MNLTRFLVGLALLVASVWTFLLAGDMEHFGVACLPAYMGGAALGTAGVWCWIVVLVDVCSALCAARPSSSADATAAPPIAPVEVVAVREPLPVEAPKIEQRSLASLPAVPSSAVPWLALAALLIAVAATGRRRR